MIRLADEQWERIRMHFPEEHIPDGRPGRKPIPTRRVFEAVLWILNTGAQWHMLPQSYPNYKTERPRPDAEILGGEVSFWTSLTSFDQPSALAVLRLITSSNLVTCTTGRSSRL
jgi:transposase